MSGALILVACVRMRIALFRDHPVAEERGAICVHVGEGEREREREESLHALETRSKREAEGEAN